MYQKPEDIAEQYELTVTQIAKGRDCYICQTGQGPKLLSPFRGSEERAEFLCDFETYMNESGCRTEQILRTREGKVLAEDESGNRYLMKTLFTGSECSTRRWEEMEQAVEALADFHEAGRDCPLAEPPYLRQEPDALLALYEKRTRELVKVKNYVRSRRSKNAFEQCFAAHFGAFYEQAQRAQELLRTGDAAGEIRILHGDYNQHNVLRTAEGMQPIHLEHLQKAPAMYDLANFLRKMMEKNGWRTELGERLIKAYGRRRPAGEAERAQLYVLLCYPEKFWKVANHYSSSHKPWLCGRDLEKLERVIAQESQKQQFLKSVFPENSDSNSISF